MGKVILEWHNCIDESGNKHFRCGHVACYGLPTQDHCTDAESQIHNGGLCEGCVGEVISVSRRDFQNLA